MNKKYTTEQTDKIKTIITKVIKGILFTILGVAVAALVGLVAMWLWNNLVTDIFSLRPISYWEAVGLFILAKIFFGGFGSSGSSDDKPMGKVKGEISKEMDKELIKELDKEFGGSSDTDSESMGNDDYEKLYEKWWQEKGEKNFGEYMSDTDSQE